MNTSIPNMYSSPRAFKSENKYLSGTLSKVFPFQNYEQERSSEKEQINFFNPYVFISLINAITRIDFQRYQAISKLATANKEKKNETKK